MIPALRLGVALSAVCVALAGAAQADAARGLQLGATDPLYQDANPATRSLLLNETVNAGADTVLLGAIWNSIAPATPPLGFNPRNPADPAYNWTKVDSAVREASARGLNVAILVTHAPTWAEGPNRQAGARAGTWKPDPTAVANFGHAIASRYSGGFPDPLIPGAVLPRVRFWQLWAEPNLSIYLTPQWEGGLPTGATHYRTMLNAFFDAIHGVRADNVVVSGGTAPYGDDPGGQRTRPVAFWRTVFCLQEVRGKKPKRKKRRRRKQSSQLVATSCPVVTKLDALAHHPINTTGGPQQAAFNPDDASSPDLDRIVRVLRAAERAGTALGGRHPVWASEIWWDSNPPNPAGSPLGRQARWIEQALYLLWRDGASVVINLRIRDSAAGPAPGLDGSGSGIFFASGQPKPSFRAYRFPFVTERIGKRLLRAWGKAPIAGKLAIQRRRGGGWVSIKRIRVRQGDVFVTKLRGGGKQRLRAKVGGERSLVWAQS